MFKNLQNDIIYKTSQTVNSMTDYKRTMDCMNIGPKDPFYFNEDLPVLQKFKPFFTKLRETLNRPDAYAVIEDDLLLLEHFQFDNTKVAKKGSAQYKVAAKTEQKFKKILVKDGDFAVLDEYVERNGKSYVENFLTQFNSHYKKIDDYKAEMQKQLKKDFKNIYMGFLIEDASKLGSKYLNKHREHCLDLLQTKEFLDVFEKATKLDFAIFAMTGDLCNRYKTFISRRTIAERRKHEIIANDISAFLFEHDVAASGLIEF